MLEKLTLKQKIVLGSVAAIVIITIGIIIFIFSESEGTEIDLSEIIENVQNTNKVNEEQTNVEQQELKETIIVHIIGEVKNAGIITLEKGSRIADAIKVAGGATSEADLDEVNLAYELQDGQQIYIPNKKDKTQNGAKTYITSESGNNVIKQENVSSNKGVNKKVNINTASQNELETLTGIGESIAKRIIEYREQNGKFQKIEELQNVKGIGNSKFTKIKDQVTIK